MTWQGAATPMVLHVSSSSARGLIEPAAAAGRTSTQGKIKAAIFVDFNPPVLFKESVRCYRKVRHPHGAGTCLQRAKKSKINTACMKRHIMMNIIMCTIGVTEGMRARSAQSTPTRENPATSIAMYMWHPQCRLHTSTNLDLRLPPRAHASPARSTIAPGSSPGMMWPSAPR